MEEFVPNPGQYEVLAVCLVFIRCFHSVYSDESSKLEDRLNEIFFLPIHTLEDAKILLSEAREIYSTLKTFDAKSETEKLKLRIFLMNVIQDIKQENMSFSQLSSNMNRYLKENNTQTVNNLEMNQKTLLQDVEAIDATMQRVLADFYAMHNQPRLDVNEILSRNVTNVDSLFRNEPKIDSKSFGIFFLEVFATIFGLTWGIVSMIAGNM